MHVILNFRMRRRYCYECDVPHPLALDGKYHMFFSRENKQIRVYKIGVHFDLQKSSMFPLVFFSLWFIKLTGSYNGATESH